MNFYSKRQLLWLFTLLWWLSTTSANSQTSLDIQVSGNNRDAQEDSGSSLDFQSDQIELGQMLWAGFRFDSVSIPQGATITNAYVQFTSETNNTESTDLTVFGHDTDNANVFNNGNKISTRSMTSASVSWQNVANWSTGSTYQTPELKAIVQEIVDRSGWSSGNNLAILIRSEDLNGKRMAWARDGSSSDAALLHVEYTEDDPNDDPNSGGSVGGLLYVSTTNNATLSGISLSDEDVASFDPNDSSASMFLDGSTIFSGNEDIDAIHVLSDGMVYLSTTGGATIGSLTFRDEDVVLYDPNTGTATLYFDGSTVFANDEDVDAFSLLSNGRIILSTTADATIGSLSFSDEDLVEYNPFTGEAVLLIDGSAVITNDSGNDFDLNGVHVNDDGTILLSMLNNSTIG